MIMKTKSESIIIASAVRSWLGEYLSTVRGCSIHTTENYRKSIELFVKYIETKKDIGINNLTAEAFCMNNIDGWLKWLKTERSCSNRTCNNRLAGLRSFLKYLSKKDSRFSAVYLKAMDIELLKYQKTKPEGMTKQAVKSLLSIPDSSTPKGMRDLTIITLLYSLGARISEILDLKMNQINLNAEKPFVCLHGKGGKTRIGYLMPVIVIVLKNYIAQFHKEKPNPDDLLFFSDYGGIRHHLSQDAVSRNLKEYARKAHLKCSDMPENIHAHTLRHARAGIWLEEGLNIVIIKELLGHENLNTTMMYIGISKEQMYNALAEIEGKEASKECRKWKRKSGSTLSEFLGLK